MRAVLAISIVLGSLLTLALLSRSTNNVTARTGRHTISRVVEASVRALATKDQNPLLNVATYARALACAQCAMYVSDEGTIRAVTGVDIVHLIDRCTRALDKATQAANGRVRSRHRVRGDRMLVATS